jgi:hypothetical protein
LLPNNRSRDVTGVVFVVRQPTISRMITQLKQPIAAVLDCEVPELVEVISGRVVITVDRSTCSAAAKHAQLLGGERLGGRLGSPVALVRGLRRSPT